LISPKNITNNINNNSPWQQLADWQLSLPKTRTILLQTDNELFSIFCERKENYFYLTLHDKRYYCKASLEKNNLHANIEQKNIIANVVQQNESITINTTNSYITCNIVSTLTTDQQMHDDQQHLRAPMPGTITAILRKIGET